MSRCLGIRREPEPVLSCIINLGKERIGELRVPRYVGCQQTARGASRGERRWGIAEDKSRKLMSRLPTPFTLVYGCLKNIPKTIISITLSHLRRALQAARLARQHIAA